MGVCHGWEKASEVEAARRAAEAEAARVAVNFMVLVFVDGLIRKQTICGVWFCDKSK
jgi:hypothetical protein